MKKFFVMCLMAIAVATSPAVQAEGLSKTEKKEVKKTAKQLSKEGWRALGPISIEQSLLSISEAQANGAVVIYANSRMINERMARVECLDNALSELKSYLCEKECPENAKEISALDLSGTLDTPQLMIERSSGRSCEMRCGWVISRQYIDEICKRAKKE